MERTVESMSTLKAIVSGGRAIIEDVGDYPDGTELELEVIANDEMSTEERAKLDAALKKSWNQAKRGETVSGETVLQQLRARR